MRYHLILYFSHLWWNKNKLHLFSVDTSIWKHWNKNPRYNYLLTLMVKRINTVIFDLQTMPLPQELNTITFKTQIMTAFHQKALNEKKKMKCWPSNVYIKRTSQTYKKYDWSHQKHAMYLSGRDCFRDHQQYQ